MPLKLWLRSTQLFIVASDSNKSSSNYGSPNRVFATTSWSMVLEAADKQGVGAEEALSDLCQQYWYPLYAFARRKGLDRTQAEDLTQAFFAELLEGNKLQHAEPSRGKFRSFLLTSLTNFMSNQWRGENALKRGGGQTILSFDYEQANDRYSEQSSDDLTAEMIFEKNWALSILDQSLTAVGEQYSQAGKRELFEAIQGRLTDDDDSPYKALAEKTGMREGALKVAVHRLRQRFGQQLRLQISKTVKDPADVDEELKSLFQALE